MREDPREDPTVSRKRFLRLAALGVAAPAALAACGGPEEGSGGGEAAQAPGKTAKGASGKEPSTGAGIAAESDVAPGSAKTFKDAGNDAVLIRLDGGKFVAYSAVCTHQGCTVAYKDAQLVCPCHGSVFDPANGGQVVNGPAQVPLPEIPVEVRGGEVYKA